MDRDRGGLQKAEHACFKSDAVPSKESAIDRINRVALERQTQRFNVHRKPTKGGLMSATIGTGSQSQAAGAMPFASLAANS